MYVVPKRRSDRGMMGLANCIFPLYEQIHRPAGTRLGSSNFSIVESALNLMAVSPGRREAFGTMLPTGRVRSPKVNSLPTVRRDPVKSTYACLSIFRDMYAIYNDWLLVIAALQLRSRVTSIAPSPARVAKAFVLGDQSPAAGNTRILQPGIAVAPDELHRRTQRLTAVPPVVVLQFVSTSTRCCGRPVPWT